MQIYNFCLIGDRPITGVEPVVPDTAAELNKGGEAYHLHWNNDPTEKAVWHC
ncbi:MAG: hypothetical protein HC769_04620 [Cyanobacteria bacterium CRU_2_1]|nr:hypothetical protein [Cyanobacteria bacterium RU_5_0]NJR58196.1 hypothetical protein [Cyanobacteria bacterium CRU_2_1]